MEEIVTRVVDCWMVYDGRDEMKFSSRVGKQAVLIVTSLKHNMHKQQHHRHQKSSRAHHWRGPVWQPLKVR